MGMYLLLLCVHFAICIHLSNGCTINEVTNWFEPQHHWMLDTHRGQIITQTTANIEGIQIAFGDGLNQGPYLSITHMDSELTVSTTDAFALYEEYETLLSIRVTITFSCVGGTTRPLTYVFNINDTNNHAPVFRPSDSYEFALALPIPPGFKVSGCDYMIVRDIDLTTYRIDFDIEDNPYFEIVYHGQIQPKEFGAYVRTKTLIRSLPDSLSLEIRATDVDNTQDDPLTSTAVMNIIADNAFRLPDPLVFSAPFYEADYTVDNDLILRNEYISLREGYDSQVVFKFQGEYSQYFDLLDNNNRLSFVVSSPLPDDISESQILLVIVAEREFTNGASATVIVHLPREIELQFELPLYEGQIKDNVLTVPKLTLAQGYEETLSIRIINEYASYFSTSREGNTITLSMRPLPTEAIHNNNVLSIQVVANTNRNASASAVVVLEIIKDDYITPIFEKSMYHGSYDTESGLVLEPIVLVQGFDDTVLINLTGDHASYFEEVELNREILLKAFIPPEIWPERNILISVVATKPRTVGANTAVLINLPAARQLRFEEPSYRGSFENNKVYIDNIVLKYGYTSDVDFLLSGEFSSYFITNNTKNEVTISVSNEIPESVLIDNNALLLSLTASGLNAITTTTNILLDIIIDDHVTPVFEKAVYNGLYDASTGLSLEQILIIQGYDDPVDVKLDGDHAHLFTPKQEGPKITLSGTVPAEIWPEQTLILTLTATKPRTVGANTVIQINLPPARELNFEQSTYSGTFRNNTVTIEEIVLAVGYSSDVKFKIAGDHSDFFTLSTESNTVSISFNASLSDEFKLDDNFIVLTISASGLNAITTFTTVLLEVLKDDSTTPVFTQHIYRGIYKNASYFEVEDISLVQGYDETVSFSLDGGDYAQYFRMDVIENKIKFNLISEIPKDLIFEEKVLLLKISATKDLTVGATAVVSIQFPTELTEPPIMGFSQSTYLGSLKDDKFEITESIILETGFRPNTNFNLYGDHVKYFELSNSNNVVTIKMVRSIPTDELRDIEFILLQIEAQRERAVTATAALVIDIVRPDPTVYPIFEKSFYTGTFGLEDGLQFEEEIRLAIGFDEMVTFDLEGDGSQWFMIKHISPNNIGLSLNGEGLPQDLSQNPLVFSVVATKENDISGRSAIVISLTDILTDWPLRFVHGYYKGYIEEGVLNLDVIALEKGYFEDVEFTLVGDYMDYFQITNKKGNITLELLSDHITEIEEKYNILILTLEARVNSLTAHTTIVLEIIKPTTNDTDHVIEFENTFYTGSYSETSGLMFYSVISVPDRLHGPIQFNLEGENSIWFRLERISENSVSITLMNPIPPGVLINNRKLIFVVTAARPESMTARATVIISLTDEYTTSNVLAFEQSSYTGSVDNDKVHLGPIVLREGFTGDVSFTLIGDLARYFNHNSNGPVVTISLRNTIPEESIPSNRLILLEIQASATQAIPAIATIVMVLNGTEDISMIEQPSFKEAYYTGRFTERDGLSFDQLITLSHGYDGSVEFALDGENSIWFGLERRPENSFAVVLTRAIPPAVLINNRKLIFIVTATRPQSVTARATVIISLTDEYTTSTVLAFEKYSYTGSVDNNEVHLEPIVLREGFTEDVSFTLIGDLARYFDCNSNGPIVTISLRNTIPEESIPSNRLILLEIQASATQAIPAIATIVMVFNGTEDISMIEQPSFKEAYYTGRFTEQDGLSFDQLISLSHGYDGSVEFALEGENSIWFGLERRPENSFAVVLTRAIPPAVLINNRKLIFIVTATRPESVTARATVIISLTNEYTTSSVLAFEQSSYTGSVDNNEVHLEPIVLREGFTEDVSFTLIGDLARYFDCNSNGPVVTISLRNTIPEESIPSNRLILLEIQASATQAIPAIATIVMVFNGTEDISMIEQPSFKEAYYTGRFTEQDGLSFDQLISLSHGYDGSVEFSLDGENSIWFGLERRPENSFAVVLTRAIPPAVLINNRKLIFIVTATRPESVTARATVIISLTNEYTTSSVLAFEQSSYTGSVDNNEVHLEPIVLREGFTEDVSFTLIGDLARYFDCNSNGPVVTISLRNTIPEESIPSNRLILLEIQASATQAIPAIATIVMVFNGTEDISMIEQPSFKEAYYTGRFTEQDGLSFDQLISLSHGYDGSVEFALDGENSIWFGLERRPENSFAVVLTRAIPPAVLINNRKLIFIVTATRPESVTARATVIISLTNEYTTSSVLAFEQSSYTGSVDNNEVHLEPIVLREGFTEDVSFTLIGDLARYFDCNSNGPVVTISLRNTIPEESIPSNRLILFEIQASATQAIPAIATIVMVFNGTEDISMIEQPSFKEAYYTGRFTEQDGLSFDQLISLSHGYVGSVEFSLDGENSIWFGLERRSENSFAVVLTRAIPPAVLINNRKLIFIVTATRPESVTARATVIISLTDEYTTSTVLAFEQSSYTGSVDNNEVHLEPIVLREGFTEDVSFTLIGDLARYFDCNSNGPVVTISLRNTIPEESIPSNRLILLEIQASATQAIPAIATIVMVFNGTEDISMIEQPSFKEAYYTGRFTEQDGLSFDQLISLSHGYDGSVEFALDGENSIWFGLERRPENSFAVVLTRAIPPAVLINNRKLIFIVTATRPQSVTARATVIISLTDEYMTSTVLAFEQSSYTGSVDNNEVHLEPIVLREGFTENVSFTLIGDLARYFDYNSNGPVVTISLRNTIPEESIPSNRLILLEIQASATQAIPAIATIVMVFNGTEDISMIEQPSFKEAYYTGRFTDQDGLSFDQLISLSHGYDGSVEFALEGENSIWFGLERRSENSFAVVLTRAIPPAVLINNRKLIFIVTATRPETVTARATAIISLTDDDSTVSNVRFDKILYDGVIRLGNVEHETITITGYTGKNIEISGQYAELFEANLLAGVVVITLRPSVLLPNVSHIALELQAGGASAVLLLNILEAETPALPTVTFGSPSYVLRADVTHTGLLGQVQASSDNGEAIRYSLVINEAHLQERLSISNDGELRLSAPANTGTYTFMVVATTAVTQASATAPVHLSIEAVTVCGDEFVVPPLIIIDRDEEEPHRNLVVLNSTFSGCEFTLTNIWPEGQSWLYVDADGLHTTAIDREHESIAFMAVSQIQVELILGCENDITSRTKRSLRSKSTAQLGPYEYGSNKWILTEPIRYNARRSFVNLIVNDINDNVPKFVGKENEHIVSIVVGYPVPELEAIILPTTLLELKATDADIGENAALVYWSSDESLAVSPTTGFVHVRNSANLQNNAKFTVHATDQNGVGHTGSLEITVKLLERSRIGVLSIRNAFLEDEDHILGNLSKTAGYEVKALRTVVISESITSRDMRASSDELGATLRVFVYGLIEQQPVDITQLISDINNAPVTVNVASVLSLEDHLKGSEICVLPGRDNGLLAATIALSVLIFILILAVAVWFFLRWRKNKNYEQFSDKNSMASRNVSVEEPKSEIGAKPRLNIEDLKRSERKLQERLDAPIAEDSTKPSTSREQPMEAIINISTPDPQMPIIIQTIDKLKDNAEESEDDDEFGEKVKSRRKSVVTFNENVEKIIHVEENPHNNTVDDYEIFRF